MHFNCGHWTAVRQGLAAHTAYVAELAGLLHQDPEAFLARLASEMAEGDQRQLAALKANPARYRANLEMLAEAGRQGARGWIDDDIAMAGNWGFGLEDIAGEVPSGMAAPTVTGPSATATTWLRIYQRDPALVRGRCQRPRRDGSAAPSDRRSARHLTASWPAGVGGHGRWSGGAPELSSAHLWVSRSAVQAPPRLTRQH